MSGRCGLRNGNLSRAAFATLQPLLAWTGDNSGSSFFLCFSTHFSCILSSLPRVKFKLILAGAEQPQWLLNVLPPRGPPVKTCRLESVGLSPSLQKISCILFGSVNHTSPPGPLSRMLFIV